MRLASLMSAIAPIVFLSPDTGTPAGGAPADTPPAEPDFTAAAGSFLGLDDEPISEPAKESSDATDPVDTPAAEDDKPSPEPEDKTETPAEPVEEGKTDPEPAKADAAKAPEQPAPAAADPLKPINEAIATATTEYQNALKAKQDADAAIDNLADDDLPTAGMLKKVRTADAMLQAAAMKLDAAHHQQDHAIAQIRDTSRQLWAKEHAELADSPEKVLETADKMYESILADVAKDPRYRTPEAQQAVALDRLETKVRQTIDGKKAAAKPPATPPQRKPHASTQVRPTGAPLKGGTGSTKTGEMEVSVESVESLLGL